MPPSHHPPAHAWPGIGDRLGDLVGNDGDDLPLIRNRGVVVKQGAMEKICHSNRGDGPTPGPDIKTDSPNTPVYSMCFFQRPTKATQPHNVGIRIFVGVAAVRCAGRLHRASAGREHGCLGGPAVGVLVPGGEEVVGRCVCEGLRDETRKTHLHCRGRGPGGGEALSTKQT